MKIFVTGGTGFIGSHFLAAAQAAGHEVLALRRPGSKPRVALQTEPHWLEGGLTDDWSNELSECRVLVHLAAVGVVSSHGNWEEMFSVNVQQSLRLWLQAAKMGVTRFVICGSCFEYGRSGERYDFIPTDAPLEPIAGYHASKAAATIAALGMCIDKQLELIVLRPFHVFGEGEAESRLWPSLHKAALAGEDFAMTPGEQIRDFIPVEQVSKAFLAAVERSDLKPGQPIVENIGTGQPQTLRAFAEHWWKTWNARGQLKIGALPYRNNEVMRYVPDVVQF